LTVFFISKELLIVNKRAVRRAQDIADLKQMSSDADLEGQS
jgi:hypothetical protein